MNNAEIEQVQQEARDLRETLAEQHHRLDTKDLPQVARRNLKVQIINTTTRLLEADAHVLTLNYRQRQQRMRTISSWLCAGVLAVIGLSLVTTVVGLATWKGATHLFLLLQALLVGCAWWVETSPHWEGIPRRLSGLGSLAAAVLLSVLVGWGAFNPWMMIASIILTIAGVGLYLHGTPSAASRSDN
ncbi:hypothetical protein [Nocardiopsis nanhaiensis]